MSNTKFFNDAVAEAKEIRETALANAKLALEEAFTPQIQSMLEKKLQEENDWILFVWCFSHRLELALKDALADFTNPVDESLMNLYYFYQKF